MSICVMNNDDLRRYIWSFLRKEAKLKCIICKKVLVWDTKVREEYYDINYNESICKYCHKYQTKFLTWSGT